MPIGVSFVPPEVEKNVEYGDGHLDLLHEGKDGAVLLLFAEDLSIHVLSHVREKVFPDRVVLQEGKFPGGGSPGRTGKVPQNIVGHDRAFRKQFPIV
jgi:hypothetical protein